MNKINEASPAPSPATRARNERDLTQRGNKENVNIRDTIRFEMKDVMEDDKKLNDQRNRLTNRHIIVLSVFLTLFGVAVGMGTLYLCYWINVDSGMSK